VGTGIHHVAFTAWDRVGNSATVAATFTVSAPAPRKRDRLPTGWTQARHDAAVSRRRPLPLR
jgi:hypothetical protein